MTAPSGEERIRKARVLYDFTGDEDNQLDITAGQMLTLIGDITPENWILAKTKDNTEGYIPDGYFEIISDSSKSKTRGPPPIPKDATTSNEANNNAYIVTEEDDDGIILEHNDTFSLFTYQLEWFTIPCIFLGALLSFMYSTPQISMDRWRLGICSWLTFICAAFSSYICGIKRNKFQIKQSSALVRMIIFWLSAILLFLSYPIGIASGIVCTLTGCMELRLHFLKCKELPTKVTDKWCSTMFGGSENCPPTKLIIFFIILAIDGAVFGWGYVDGYNFAIDNNEFNPSHWLEPVSNSFMWGFARIISINLCLILLLECRQCFSFCVKKSKEAAKKLRKNKNKSGNNRNRDRNIDINIAGFFHRCMGYSIVFGTFLHLICVYFTYEDSLSTHTFMDAYGWETFATGWFILLLFASVVASSNETLSKTNKRLFHQTHWQSLLMIFVLIFHGKSFVSTYYWQLIIVPIVFYSCHVVVKYLKGN
eukprot:180550_1